MLTVPHRGLHSVPKGTSDATLAEHMPRKEPMRESDGDEEPLRLSSLKLDFTPYGLVG